MSILPIVNAIKLKKDIWFLKAGQVYFIRDGQLWSHEPGLEPMMTMDSLAQAIMSHVDPEYDDDPYIEVLDSYKPKPAEFIRDIEGNEYKLIKSAPQAIKESENE